MNKRLVILLAVLAVLLSQAGPPRPCSLRRSGPEAMPAAAGAAAPGP
jgi:hypothetical protein